MTTQHIEGRELEVKDLLPGDLFLSMARSEFAKLIGWVGDVEFSHASVVYDPARLIEATPPQVRLASLEERAASADKLRHLEVLRPVQKLAAEDEAALRAKGANFLGRAYSKGTLIQLAVTAAIRNKAPLHPEVRRLFKWIVDHAIHADPKELVCTELAYRIYSEGKYPTKSLTPILPDVPPRHPPLPDFDYLELYKEIRELIRKKEAPDNAADAMTPDLAELEDITANLAKLSAQKSDLMAGSANRTGDGLEDSYAQLLGKLQTYAQADGAAGQEALLQSVNPKTVLLIELWESPSFTRLGRLKLTKGDSRAADLPK